MGRLCRWGMHKPGLRKVFHRGHLFTRCTDCETTLMSSAGCWHQVPANQRVVWRTKTSDDHMFAESANFDRSRLPFQVAALLKRR
jgi:hypothetical protein